MDKKNFTIGALLLVAAFALMIFSPKPAPSPVPATAQPATTAAQPAGTQPSGSSTTAGATAPAAQGPERELIAINRESAEAVVTLLSNEFIEARFTNFGGAIRDVAFKAHPAVLGKPELYAFNQAHADPILAFTGYKGLDKEQRYDLVSATATEVVYRTVLEGNLEVTRRYRLMPEGQPGGDPYRIHHETTFKNLTGATQALQRGGLSLGTAALMDTLDYGQFLNVAAYDGEDPHYIDPSDLEGGMISGAAKTNVTKPGKFVWGAVKNQFFTSIYTVENPAANPTTGIVVRRVELPAFPNSPRANIGITASTTFDLPALAANGTAKLAGIAYVGPLEYRRIAKFETKEDRVFPFFRGFNKFFLSGYVSPLQNLLMNAIHGSVGNWGVAIILMTLVLKIISLPFTLAASRSAKRMAKLQPELQAIREKFKDNPQKQQMATMEVFKSHKVNPVGGCIPILITMPLFIGFFAMLQSPAELRFQPFLWAKDLASPDTVGHLFGIAWLPINIMPLLMGATMYYQMQLTPTPSVDNMQMKMMKFMPVIFTIFCYQFSCALSLYSTINGIFTIVQQVIVNRMNDTPTPVSAGATAATTASVLGKGKGLKNVTPGKPKKLK